MRSTFLKDTSDDRADQGRARPMFRVLAIVPACLCWFGFYVAVRSHPGVRDATLQDWWHVVLACFGATLFSLAALRGHVPRWLWRRIPHTWAWEDDTRG